MTPEQYFLMYAFPCSESKLHNKIITPEEYKNLESMFINKESPKREILQRVYAPACKDIKKYAQKLSKNPWDLELLQEFWHEEHNKIIDRGEGDYALIPEVLKEHCKVKIGEVVKIVDAHTLLVKIGEKQQPVINQLIPDIKVSEKIRIHQAYAIERV